MEERLDYAKAAPGAYQAMLGIESYVRRCGLEHALLELVKTRVSQINGCAYCLDMHTQDPHSALRRGDFLVIVGEGWRPQR